MDKETLTYSEQSALFDRCIKAFGETEKYGVAVSAMSLHGHNINFIYPEESWTGASVKENGMADDNSPDIDAIRIYISDAGCRGFKMPVSLIDRFRFTYRGDILGFEEGSYRGTFFREAGAVSVVSFEDNSAVILFRGKTAPPKERFLQVIVATLSLLMEKYGVLFLPLKTLKDEDGCRLVADRLPGIDIFDPGGLFLWKIRFSEFWVAIKREQSFIAQPFPCLDRSSEPVATIISNLLITDSGKTEKAVVPEMVKQKLIYDTLNILPFSGPSYIRFIETLFSDLTPVFDDSKKPSSISESITYPTVADIDLTLIITGKTEQYPKLSVILPAYNAEAFLYEAVDSVTSLNYPDLELLIIDDGSDDDTGKVAQSLPVECRYFYQDNMGPSAARNRGIRESTGDLILILDADDLINSSGVRNLIDILLNNPDFCGVKGYAQKFRISDTEETVFQGSPAESFPFYIGSAVFRREAFEKNGLFDEDLRLCEDTLWFTNAENRGLKIYQAEVISLFVRRHKANITLNSELHDLSLLKMLKKLT